MTCLATAGIVAISLLTFHQAGIRIVGQSLLTYNSLLGFILLPVAVMYTLVRFDQHIASFCGSLSLLLLLGPALCMFTYATTIVGGAVPLQDAAFAALDRRLGFDWPDQLAFFDDHATVVGIGRLAYRSILYQAGFALVALTLAADAERLQDMIIAFGISCVICAVVAGLLPAVGAYAYYGVSPAQHSHIDPGIKDITVRSVMALREGRQTVFDFGTAEGIISFPSFHASLGLLFIWTFWKIPVVKWVALVLNMMLIAATPLNGSHYLIDVVAGLFVSYGSLRLTLALRQAFVSRARVRVASWAGGVAA